MLAVCWGGLVSLHNQLVKTDRREPQGIRPIHGRNHLQTEGAADWLGTDSSRAVIGWRMEGLVHIKEAGWMRRTSFLGLFHLKLCADRQHSKRHFLPETAFIQMFLGVFTANFSPNQQKNISNCLKVRKRDFSLFSKTLKIEFRCGTQ